MMRCCSKETLCHSNSPPKVNNGVCHACPSKLTKRELEDLYYNVAQNNLELKQTINQLSEKIKYQTTKLQRMLHTQQSYMGSEPRDCCATAKAIVQEQKQVIIELKNANEDLQEQINNLNMKLCSTKQFLPRSTAAKTTPRGRAQSKNSPANRQKGNNLPRSTTTKNSSTSALHQRCLEEAAQSTGMKSVSSQHLDSAGTKTPKSPNTPRKQKTDPPGQSQSARKTDTPSKAPITNKMCDQNKCRSQMEEMEQKILKLQEELAKTHDEYANRIARLEREVIDLHAENMKVCSEKSMFEQNMKARSNEAGDIKKKLIDAEIRYEKLNAHLNIEKRKVSELETQVKAAKMTAGAMRTIEERLNNGNTPNTRRDSIHSTRSGVTSPIANASETNNTENRNLQGLNCPNKRICCFKDLSPGICYYKDLSPGGGSPKQEENHPDTSKFPDNLKQIYTKYVEPEEPNIKFDVKCRCPVPDKSTTSDGQDKPMTCNDPVCKSNIKGNQNLPANKGRGPNGINDNSERKAASDKLPIHGASVTSRDNVQNQENIDQDSIKYRENIASRLRNKDRPKEEPPKDTDTRSVRGNKNQLNEQELDRQANRNSLSIVNLDNDTVQGDANNSENTTDQRKSGSPRGVVDKNVESGAGKCLKPGDEKTDYTTEYGRQFNNTRRNSMGVRSPEKQDGVSPPLSQIVNKSNESSCYCSGKCQCINANKIILTTAGTATTSAGSDKETPMSAADEEVLKKFKAMFEYTSIELAATPPQPLQKPGSPQVQTPMAQRGVTSDKSPDTSIAKTVDDSGFNEPDVCCAATPEGRALLRENRELENKVAEMQAQLEQLKTHVLSRKKTYTVFKDEGTTSDSEQKTECGIQIAAVPFDASAQTASQSVRIDPKRVCLKVPRKGYVLIEQQPDQEYQRDQDGKIERIRLIGPKYTSPGQSNPESSCESTCVKEGLPCTKECLSVNKEKVPNQKNIQKSDRKKYDNSRYQIQGPLPAYSSDVPATKRIYDQNACMCDKQPTQLYNSAPHQIEENNHDVGSPQNTNFYKGMNPMVPMNTGSIKEESPPTNRTQYINMEDAITNGNNQEESLNAPYARGTVQIPNDQYGKNGSQLREPLNARTTQYTNNDPYPLAKETPKTTPYQENEEDCCTKHQRLQGALVKPVAADLMPRENESETSGKNTPAKDASKDKKKLSITCMCPHDSEYTTNILHTATGPNYETSKSRATTSNVNAENITLSNSLPHNSQQKTNTTQNTNLPNIQDNSHIRSVPGYDGGLGASSSERRELFEIKETDRSKLTKSAANEENNNEEKPLFLKQSNMGDAGKVLRERNDKSEQKKEVIDKVNNIYDEKERIFAKSVGDKRDKRNENVNLYENRFVEKSSGLEENNAKKNDIQKVGDYEPIRINDEQLLQKRLTRFIDNNGPVKPSDNKREDEIQSRLVDVDSRERQFVGNNTGGGKIQNIDGKQEIKRRDSHLSTKTLNDNNDTDKMRQAEPFYYQQPISTPVATSSPFTCSAKRPNQNLRIDRATDNQLDICESFTRVCLCPQPNRRDVAVFRSCSGTLRFRTVNTPSHIRKCSCPKPDSMVTCGTQQGNADNIETELNTYTIEASANVVKDDKQRTRVQMCSRATSPENTDQEISSLTDLPSERETTTTPSQSACRKCTRRSPGEDKSTTTKSETVTDPTSSSTKPTTFPLSEGEMPQYSARPNNQRQESVYTDPQPPEQKRRELAESSSLKVEQALASISEELARCRQLLEKPKEVRLQKPEKETKNTLRLKDLAEYEQLSDDERDQYGRRSFKGAALNQIRDPNVIALHHAQAKPHISNGPDTPHVMFTLHIGTVVLSDEAVINSRNLNLVLTWKFYDQNVAMSHMRPGRVIHFDFSTEYDLKLTDQFLNYLKAEELQIKICEVNKLDFPIASCSLPLREALLHTNRRADMSLALVAGPYMMRSTPDSLDTRDEMGVLDLWCMLRAEPRIVPRINKAIAKSRPSRVNGNGMRQQSYATNSLSPLITQLDDDQDDVHLSTDLDQTFQPDRLPVKDSNNLIDRGAEQELTNQMRQSRRRITNYGYLDPETASTQSKAPQHFMAYPHHRPRVSISVNPPDTRPARFLSTNTDIITQLSSGRTNDAYSFSTNKDLKRTASGFIINEVPAAIRSDEQMKQAIKERTKLTHHTSMAPTLQDKYAETNTHTRQDARRLSGGQFSIQPSLGNTMKSMAHPAQAPQDSSSLNLGPTAYSVSRDWKKADDKDPKKFLEPEPTRDRRDSFEPKTSRYDGTKKAMESYKTVKNKTERIKLSDRIEGAFNYLQDKGQENQNEKKQTIDIIILWLALNEECAAMSDPTVQRLYVAYNFLGRSGAELETPQSLPKPKQYQDKCYFNFRKSFQLTDADLAIVGRLARCRSPNKGMPNPKDSVVFTVVSEPVEDPLGLNNCEDIGVAYLYFGDLVAYSANSDTYTEVIPIRDCKEEDGICGVLSIRVDGLNVVRKCLTIY